jgi:KipI family sensor histidine kinase inhibitor
VIFDTRIEFLGDAALLLRLGNGIDGAVNRRVHACAAALRSQAPGWLVDLTPAYACLALHVDVGLVGGADALGSARAWLAQWLERTPLDTSDANSPTIEIPVVYGGEYGPDLSAVATHAGIAIGDAVARHTTAHYTVAMLGFAPGFPYLLGLDASLAMPRIDTPRTRVAAGSVGIGGAQTGIYPQAGPGGWRLIGRTPLRLFDARRDTPSLLQAGDRVRFVAIDAATFDAMDEHAR